MKKSIILFLFWGLCANPLVAEEPYRSDSSSRLVNKPLKSLYLSYWGAGSSRVKNRVLNLSEETEINAVVIDIKNEYGQIAYPGNIETARKIGAYKHTTIKNPYKFIADLKAQGLYVIGRVVVFKDHQLATKHPELAIKDSKGKVWINNEKLGWGNPTLDAVHTYNIQVAMEAIKYGVDEVNFDYIRFPTERGLNFGLANTEANRVGAINSFLAKAKRAIAPTGAKISVDTYGYVCWNEGDTGIGQRLTDMLRYADYVCPMLYPSGFHLGIPEYKDPMENIYEVIFYTLQRAYERTKVDKHRFRPWLQAFRDYSFDKRPFKEKEIREQIDAAEHFGAGGWFLWHPGSYFVAEGLKPAHSEVTRIVSTAREVESYDGEILQLKPVNNF